MKAGPLLIAGLAASVIGTAGGCGIVNNLLGREQNTNQWLQQNQAKVFQELDEPDPEIQPFTHFAAGQLLEGKKQLQQAIIQYRKALALNPKFVGAHNRMAICLDKLGKHAEAERALRRAIKVNPKLAYLRNNLAFSLMAQKRWGDSERELRTALQLKPDYQRARVNLGIVMCRLAKREEAFQQFQMVLGDARAHYNMGLMDKSAGRYGQAAESFRNAIALEPKLQAAKIQLEKLRALASAAPWKPEQQTNHVAPSRSVAATDVPPRQPRPVQTIRVAVEKEQVQEQEIVKAKAPATPLPRKRDDVAVKTAVAAQAEPDISGMSIGYAEEPIATDEMEANGADFSWEVADASAPAPSDSPAPTTAIEQPAPKTTVKAPTVVAVAPRLVAAQLSDPAPTAPAAITPEPAPPEIEASSLPFFTYEEPCEVRDAERYAPRPERDVTLCAEDEVIDQFVLGESGFDPMQILPTSVPQPALAANTDGHDTAAPDKSVAWTPDEWRRFAREHHLATDGSNLPSVLMRLQGNLAKQWRPIDQPAGSSAPAPTIPNPAAEIELSATGTP